MIDGDEKKLVLDNLRVGLDKIGKILDTERKSLILFTSVLLIMFTSVLVMYVFLPTELISVIINSGMLAIMFLLLGVQVERYNRSKKEWSCNVDRFKDIELNESVKLTGGWKQ